MTKYRTFYNITLFFTITVALALTAMRTVALIADFDVVEGYYAHGTFLSDCFTWCAVIASAVVFAIAYLLRRSLSDITPRADSSVIIFTSALLAFMIIAVFIADIFTLNGTPALPELLALIFAVPAALYPLIGIALPIRSREGKIVLGALMLLWLFAVTLSIYFTDGIAINNPNRSLELAAVALILVFFVYECRYSLGHSTPWCYIGFGLAAVIVGGMYSLPNIILVLMNIYPDKLDVTFEFILAVIWVYILLRLCTYSYDIIEPGKKRTANDGAEEDDVNDDVTIGNDTDEEENEEYIDDVIKVHNREVARERMTADDNGLTVEFKKINDRLD